MGESILQLRQIRKSFDNTEVLKGIDLEAGTGRIYYPVGSFWLRQDHDAAYYCGVGTAGCRTGDPGRTGHYEP